MVDFKIAPLHKSRMPVLKCSSTPYRIWVKFMAPGFSIKVHNISHVSVKTNANFPYNVLCHLKIFWEHFHHTSFFLDKCFTKISGFRVFPLPSEWQPIFTMSTFRFWKVICWCLHNLWVGRFCKTFSLLFKEKCNMIAGLHPNPRVWNLGHFLYWMTSKKCAFMSK